MSYSNLCFDSFKDVKNLPLFIEKVKEGKDIAYNAYLEDKGRTVKGVFVPNIPKIRRWGNFENYYYSNKEVAEEQIKNKDIIYINDGNIKKIVYCERYTPSGICRIIYEFLA
jgi:hypothetical protein